MNNLEKAISLINNNRIPEFFDLMDKEIGANHILNQLRMEFISGHATWNFHDKLKILANNTLKTMTTDQLKNLVKTNRFSELFEVLDTYFDKNPDYQYSNLKQNIHHQLNNGNSPTPAQLQGLLVFLNGKVVRENLGNFKQAIEVQKNTNNSTINGNGNFVFQEVTNSTVNFNDTQILPKHQEIMSESFKEYYIKSIQELNQLPTFVEKNDLLENKEYYEATFNLYSKYAAIYLRYLQYTTQHLGEDLGFALYKRTDFLPTETVYKSQTTILLEEIAKLRTFLLELNNPLNADGLYKAIIELKDLKEEKQYLLLFKQFIQALKAEDLSCYDLVGNLDIKVLLNEIKDFDIIKSVEKFWSYVALEHTKATGLGKKKVFVENLLKTQEIVQNLNYLISNLIK